MILENIDLATLWPFAVGLLAAGIIAGILAGLLGVGGGIVIVPVLFHVFTALGIDESVRMHLAVGTSLATIVPTSIRSLRSHAKRGAVDKEILRVWAWPILGGVMFGTIIAAFVGGQVLTMVFATLALAVAFNMAFGNENWRLGQQMPSRTSQSLMAGVMGVLSTLMGIGGGTFGVTAMTLFGVPIHRAVATASGFGLIIAVPAAIGFMITGFGVEARPPFSIGYVNLIGFALIVPMTVAAAPLGVRLAHAMPRKTLIRAFAFFLLITSIRMFWSLLS